MPALARQFTGETAPPPAPAPKVSFSVLPPLLQAYIVATAIGAGSMLILGLLIGRRRLYDAMQPTHLVQAGAAAATSAGPQPIFDGSGDRR